MFHHGNLSAATAAHSPNRCSRRVATEKFRLAYLKHYKRFYHYIEKVNLDGYILWDVAVFWTNSSIIILFQGHTKGKNNGGFQWLFSPLLPGSLCESNVYLSPVISIVFL